MVNEHLPRVRDTAMSEECYIKIPLVPQKETDINQRITQESNNALQC